LTGAVLEAQLDFWRRELEGAPTLLELPTDRPRPAVQSYRGAAVSFTLPADAAAAVQTLARQAEATPFMVLLATFQTLLHRWSGTDDVVVGSPVANRNRVEIEDLIGFFVNTLVFRLRLRTDDGFLTALERLRATTLASHEHQDLPLELLVDALAVERSLAHTPLFQVMLALQNAPAGELRVPGLTFSPVDWQSTTAKFDLTLTFTETNEGFTGTLEHATDLYDGTTARRLLSHFATLLASAAAQPGRRLCELSLLSAAERHQLLAAWNDTEVDFGSEACLHELVSAQAARTPEAVAVVFREEEITYRELDLRSGRLARRLRTLGIGPEVLVGIAAQRSLELVVGLLAILKAGGAYVPLDPGYPEQRLAFMLADSGVPVLLTQEALAEKLVAMSPPGLLQVLLDVDDLEDEAAQGAGEGALSPGVGPDNAAYVIYTSGSTGRPKGVANTHRGIVNHMLWMQRAYPLAPADRVLQKTSYSFDASVWEIFSPLLAGASMVLAEPDGHQDVRYLVNVVERYGITTLQLVPSVCSVFLEEEGVGTACRSLRRLFCGGEALPAELVERCRDSLGAELCNLYGPTEAAVDAASWVCGREPWRRSVPIGRPIDNLRIHLLDRAGEPVPIGVAGELHAGGVGLGRGYLNRPGLTAERFVPDSLSSIPGARLYRTGDLARHLPSGEIEYLGRTDHQVKIRGVRIELGEIQAVLDRHPGVRESRVLARKDGPGGGSWLVAYFVPADGAPEEPALRAVLQNHLQERLPQHMVPAAFVLVPAWPLTPNGKVDLKALPSPAARSRLDVKEMPRTPTEAQLAEIWIELLGIAAPGREESFFKLGGHSLLATRLISRVRALGVDLPLRALFEAPTIASLAERIDGLRSPQDSVALPLLPTGATEIPLSFAQERLWFLDQLQPGSSLYNIPAVLCLTGDLDTGALERSFTEIVRRHGSLRTTFTGIGGETRQVVAPPGAMPLPVIDLSGLPAPWRDREAERRIEEEVSRPFDLACGPVLRLHLLRHGRREHTLIANVHHIASDGWSMGVLVRESTALYQAFVQGLPSPLPDLPVQYVDFALWQRRWLTGPVLEAQLDFWKRELAGAPALLELPTDRPRPAVQSSRGALLPFFLPAPATAAIHTLSQRAEATPFMVLLAAFQTLLHRWSGADDVLVGSPVANRGRIEVEELIGVFVNTLVFRLQPLHGESFLAVLERVRATTLAGQDHQDLPFELLVEALGVPRSLAHNPLFQVMLVLQNTPLGELRAPGLTFSPAAAPTATAKFDLTLSLGEMDGVLAGALEYATDLFDPPTVERFLGHLGNLLASAAEDSGQPLSGLRLMDAAEERQVLAGLNPAGHSWVLPVAVHDLFVEQARRTPEKTAAVGPLGGMTYRELDERSNALAARLPRQLDLRVALLTDPDPQILVGMLGILKAGGGFVPIDPRSPDERLAWILADSACEVLVTQERHRERAAGLGFRQVLCFEDPDAAGTAEDVAAPVEPGSLAYIVYTSGSTGRPKGVQISHQSLVPMLLWGCEYLGLGE
ncbi:MAG TPA: amino acid adenylation domain-containing protein, partial [Thermoanaerobaculia bacterium]|nr:amino acid adenylation domain-containing protein [Thermoanaerobaculia bacterium]